MEPKVVEAIVPAHHFFDQVTFYQVHFSINDIRLKNNNNIFFTTRFSKLLILKHLIILWSPRLSKLLMLQVNLCQKLFFLQNMGRTCCLQKFFWMSATIYVHNMFSPGLSLEFSCIEQLVIQYTICRHIVG